MNTFINSDVLCNDFYDLSALVGCWFSVFVKRIITKNLFVVLLITQLFAVSGKVGILLIGFPTPIAWMLSVSTANCPS